MPTYHPTYVRSEGPEEQHSTYTTDTTSTALTRNSKFKKVYISVVISTYPASYVRSEEKEKRHRTSSTNTTSPALTKISKIKKITYIGYNSHLPIPHTFEVKRRRNDT
ncbi:hypothetical protein TNCV_4280351 [Trichonephila clavipes]|nr:hypothetical protein TNCV_4280351 [Trichonephila clavipes]